MVSLLELLVTDNSALRARTVELEERAREALDQLEASRLAAQVEIKALLCEKEQLKSLNSKKASSIDALRTENGSLLKSCESLMTKLQTAEDRLQFFTSQLELLVGVLGFDDTGVEAIVASTSELIRGLKSKFFKAVEISGPQFAEHIPQILHIIQACEAASEANEGWALGYRSVVCEISVDGLQGETLSIIVDRPQVALESFQKLNQCVAG